VLTYRLRNVDEFRDDAIALERGQQASVHVDRGLGLLGCAGQRDPDIGMFGFTGPVHHAAHHRHRHGFDARIIRLPLGHLVPQVGLDLVRHLLEEGAGGAPATRAGGHLRGEAADTERLQDLLRDRHLFGAVAVGQRRQRYADGVPMPSCNSGASAAVEATIPLLPMPASVRPRCSG